MSTTDEHKDNQIRELTKENDAMRKEIRILEDKVEVLENQAEATIRRASDK